MKALLGMIYSIMVLMVKGFVVAPSSKVLPGECSAGLRSARLVSAGLGMIRQSSTPSRTTLMSATAEVEDELAEKIVNIRPKALDHIRELRRNQGVEGDIFLRMGVRSGGCSGLSYVMDLMKEDEVTEDDMVEQYDGFKCVIDPKSVLYLYGLELDFSDALIGGGFQFQNPNAESSCGCGKSFGV